MYNPERSSEMTLPLFLYQQPSYIIAQRKYNPARDPCSVLWDVLLDDLVTMELTHGKKDQPKAPFSQLVLYQKTRPPEFKEQVRVIKCNRDTHQAYEIYSSVERAMSTYGPSKSKVCTCSCNRICLSKI